MIGALKGLGGFHLTCDAGHLAAVGVLRQRKLRDEKPFAIMVRDVATAKEYCQVSADEEKLLRSPARPIVLLHKRSKAGIAEGVSPLNPCLGIMLPYTPLHHLLLEAVGGIPLVMTSGNRSDEPIAFEERDALNRLDGIADLFLIHDRPIHVRCDDSVTRVVDGSESFVRRSRGYAPQPIGLPVALPSSHSCRWRAIEVHVCARARAARFSQPSPGRSRSLRCVSCFRARHPAL